MRKVSLIILLLFIQSDVFCQKEEIPQESRMEIKNKIINTDKYTVATHKDTLNLEIIFHNIKFAHQTLTLNRKVNLKINFESDYIQVHDSLFVKVYLSRNKENGNRFYGMRWEYFILREEKYETIGKSLFIKTFYNYDQHNAKYNTPNGFGMGSEGSPDYFMIKYWYILK